MVSELKGYARFVSEQSPYNLLDRRIENELVPLCQAYGLGILAWSPLAHGMLAGRYAAGEPFSADSRAGRRGGIYAERISPRGIEAGGRFVELARRAGIAPAQLAVLWVKDQPGVTAPIIGPRTLQHLEDALAVVDKKLDDADRPLFDALVHPGNAVADFHNNNEWMKARVVS